MYCLKSFSLRTALTMTFSIIALASSVMLFSGCKSDDDDKILDADVSINGINLSKGDTDGNYFGEIPADGADFSVTTKGNDTYYTYDTSVKIDGIEQPENGNWGSIAYKTGEQTNTMSIHIGKNSSLQDRLFTFTIVYSNGFRIIVLNQKGLTDEAVPSGCKFNITVSSDSSFYESWYSPFELLHFKLTDSNGDVKFSNPAFEYFDSITWRREDNKGGYYTLSVKNTNGISAKTEWSTYFYDNNDVVMVAEGWKDGRVAYGTYQNLVLRLSSFLCYDWSNGAQPVEKYGTGIYNIFDKDEEYNLYPPRDDGNGHLYSRLFIWENNGKELSLDEQRDRLLSLFSSYYITHREIKSDTVAAKVRAHFHCMPATDTPVYYWLTPKYARVKTCSHIALMYAPGDEELGTPGRYYIHAEPAD